MALKAVEQEGEQVPADDFQALEAKIYRTIEMYKAAGRRKARRNAIAAGGTATGEQEEELAALRQETVQLRKEREEIRSPGGKDAGADRDDCGGKLRRRRQS